MAQEQGNDLGWAVDGCCCSVCCGVWHTGPQIFVDSTWIIRIPCGWHCKWTLWGLTSQMCKFQSSPHGVHEDSIRRQLIITHSGVEPPPACAAGKINVFLTAWLWSAQYIQPISIIYVTLGLLGVIRINFQCEFNGDVGFVIGVTVYGRIGKHTRVIHHLELFFDMNLMVMSNWCSEWPLWKCQ